MNANPPIVAPTADDEVLSQEKVNQIIEEHESESRMRTLHGAWQWLAAILAGGLAVYALYWTQYSITTQFYRASFLMVVLCLTFLHYPTFARDRNRLRSYDLLLIGLSIASLVYLLYIYEDALQRITRPTNIEIAMGTLLILLILEATRRSTGWALTLTAVGFLAYAFLGPSMPEPFDHRGYRLPRIVGQNYLTLEGIFGVPLDVAATFIVLFTIYGAVLEYSGAGKFFLDWSFAALGKSRSGAGPGRTVTAAGFLLGTVSGSGIATTVTLGSLAWPMLKRAGYDRETAGGMLSAAGIGAILSPPTLGAAAFIIAEYLRITYLDVLVMAVVPTILYYISCFLMIEADSRRLGTQAVDVQTTALWPLTLRYGYHFSSLFAVAVLMGIGMTPFMAVFWAIMMAFALSFLQPETRLTSFWALGAGVIATATLWALGWRISTACFWGLMVGTAVAAAWLLWDRWQNRPTQTENTRILKTLEYGGKSVVSIAATTACAGVIVSIVTLTGLGLKMSGVIVGFAGGNLFLTVLLAALAIWVLGLAVPVTASYIIAAVMIVPALTLVGVNEAAAHMFVFYYAVLADVSPPTALAPMAAAAITGGKPFRTIMMAWKYCLPAFLVPFMFTLSPEGLGLLLMGDLTTILWTFITSCVAVAALAVAFGGWLRQAANGLERLLIGAGGLALLYANLTFDLIGFTLLLIGIGLHLWRVRQVPLAV
ncbi:MAG: TRAP transporter fused permease subunit [Chloroflexota bacterium]|nr:TRAP transporter fused permease subunit [Chloroflexota bacterium]